MVDRYRVRRPDTSAGAPPGPAGAAPSAAASTDDGLFDPPETSIVADDAAPDGDPTLDQIRREGLTGRQLRLARRMAQMHGLAATSDHDAVRQLRAAGIDPFDRSAVLDVVQPEPAAVPSTAAPSATAPSATAHPASSSAPSTALATRGEPRLPAPVQPIRVPSTDMRAAEAQAGEIARIQADLSRRRQRKSLLLLARLAVFVGLPTLLMGWYFYVIATPLYEAKSAFIIQSADNAVTAGGMGGLGGLGGMMERNDDSLNVQAFLQSRDAMDRLDADIGFKAIFQNPAIDPLQRLAPDASDEDAFRAYTRTVSIAYDPTERIVRMTVRTPDPQTSVQISNALIGYAEERIDDISRRMREQQMTDATQSHQNAQAEMASAQARVVELQQKFDVLSSEAEVGLITGQIGQLETQLSADRLSLAQMELNESPNEARMEPVRQRIAAIEAEIATLRQRMTQGGPGGVSLAEVQSALLMAQADVQTRQLMLASTLQQLETARIEANRQVRYLSLSVRPVAQDEAAWPRAFENTMVAGLIFAGIYLMIAMTAAILREQVSA
jgi:capsular polysaccharide transport system permease protein